MAENAQFFIEQLNDDLYAACFSNSLISPTELKHLSQSIFSFEHKLQRRISKKQDFIAYAHFWMALGELLGIREAKASGKTTSPGKTKIPPFCIAKISQIWSRATSKFPADLSFWLHRVEHALRWHKNKKLEEIFATALQLHPLSLKLWCLAARWEAEHNLNMPAARALIQRALRLCPESDSLWLELFSLELAYWTKIHQRRQVLGIQESADSTTGEKPLNDEAFEMMKLVVNHAVESVGEAASGKFLWEALAFVSNESKEHHNCLSFYFKSIEDFILETMKSKSTNSIHYRILHQWKNNDSSQDEQKTSMLFWTLLDELCESFVVQQPSEEAISFCWEFCIKYAPDVAKAKSTVISALEVKLLDVLPSEKIVILLVDHFQQVDQLERAKEIAKSSIQAGNSCSFSLWKAYISLELATNVNIADEKQIESLLIEAVHSMNAKTVNEKDKPKAVQYSNTDSSNEKDKHSATHSSHELRVFFLDQLSSSPQFAFSLAKKLMFIDYSIPLLHWYLEQQLLHSQSSIKEETDENDDHQTLSPSLNHHHHHSCECQGAISKVRQEYLRLAKDWRDLSPFWMCCLEFEQQHYATDHSRDDCPAKLESQKAINDIWQKVSRTHNTVVVRQSPSSSSNAISSPSSGIIALWIGHLQWLVRDVGDWMQAAQLATKASQVLDPQGRYEFMLAYQQLKSAE